MAYQSREYFCNGKSILLNSYQDVDNAKNDQEIDALNSMGSGFYQSNKGDNFNRTGNQFMDSTRFNNQSQKMFGTSNNFNKQNGEMNSIYSKNTVQPPVQNFDLNNNSNGFQTQKNYYNTDGMNYQNQNQNQNQSFNNVGMNTNYQQFNINNQQSQKLTQPQLKKKLEELVENLYDYYYSTKN